MEKDPIEIIEEVTKEMHDTAGRITQPILRKYPLLFTFLITFSVAAIIHGFELWSDEFEVFHRYPSLLMLLGIAALLCTGMLYKTLTKAAGE